MPGMEEQQIYEALGVAPAQPEGEGAKAQEVAAPAAQPMNGTAAQHAGNAGRAAQEPTTPTGEGAKEQEPATPAGEQRNGTPAQPAADAGRAPEGTTPASDPAPAPEGQKAETEPQQDASAKEGAALTDEQRKEYAAQRRRQEQQDAINAAVNDALAREKERSKAEWADFFKKANLKNTLTQQPITNLEEFNDWAAAFEAAKLQRDLKAGKLTPEGLEKAISNNPVMQRMKEITERDEAARRERDMAAAKAKIDAELLEIQKLDPSIKDTHDLLTMPNAKEFYEYVKIGNSFIDAFYLANRERLAARTAEAAKQQTMNAARSKDHLNATGTARGAGASTVPAEEMEMFKLLNPNATDAEIQAYYNKTKQ